MSQPALINRRFALFHVYDKALKYQQMVIARAENNAFLCIV